MKAKEGVVEFLNRVLKSELTVVYQDLLHFSGLIDQILRTIDQVGIENYLTEQVKGAEA